MDRKPFDLILVASLTVVAVAVTLAGVTQPAARALLTLPLVLVLPGYALAGAVCGLGTSGAFTWTGVPAGNLWFVVTGVNGAGTEASWGPATSGERNGALASGHCGNTARSNAGSCP